MFASLVVVIPHGVDPDSFDGDSLERARREGADIVAAVPDGSDVVARVGQWPEVSVLSVPGSPDLAGLCRAGVAAARGDLIEIVVPGRVASLVRAGDWAARLASAGVPRP